MSFGGYHTIVEKFHFAIRLNLLHFPLDQEELESVLQAANYTMRRGSRTLVPAGSGIRVTLAGPIAQSSDGVSTFAVTPDRGILALMGRSIDNIINEFGIIEKAIQEQYISDWGQKALFYEFILDGHARMGPGRNPIEEMRVLHQGSQLFEALGEALGFSTTTYGLRLAEKGKSPDDISWVEYKVEPAVGKSTTDYLVNIVYRDKDRENVVKEAGNALVKIERIFDVLKGDA